MTLYEDLRRESQALVEGSKQGAPNSLPRPSADPSLARRSLRDPAPDRSAVTVALIEQLVGSLRGPYGRVDAVLVGQQLRGAEDVGVGDHVTVQIRGQSMAALELNPGGALISECPSRVPKLPYVPLSETTLQL